MSKCYEVFCEGMVNRFITVEANNEEEAQKSRGSRIFLLVGANENDVKIIDLEECDDD